MRKNVGRDDSNVEEHEKRQVAAMFVKEALHASHSLNIGELTL